MTTQTKTRKRSSHLWLSLSLVLAFLLSACTVTPMQPSPTAMPLPTIPAATPTPPAVTDLAVEFVDLLVKEDFSAAFERFDTTMKGALPEADLQAVWESLLAQIGSFQEHVEIRVDKVAEYDRVYVTGEFEQATIDVIIVFDSEGRVAGLFFAPTESSAARDPVPYDEEEVTFQNGDITLVGTLSLPPTNGPHPAVILITGSGPQTRDEEVVLGFKVFQIIADHLTRNGIAVLRYDDRGMGGSTGDVNQSTTEDFAGDVLAAVALLKDRADINPSQIGLLGHSEGGIVAPIAATRSDDVAFIILMAGPGVQGAEILLAQAELILRAEGATEEEIEIQREMQLLLFEAVRTNEGWDEAADALRAQAIGQIDALSESEREQLGDIDQLVERLIEQEIQKVQTPWWKFFLDYDPAPTLAQVTVPVLAIFGELDLQVPAEMNEAAMETILAEAGNEDYTIVTLPKANHLFQSAGTGSISEYATLEKGFGPEFLGLVTGWILERTAIAE